MKSDSLFGVDCIDNFESPGYIKRSLSIVSDKIDEVDFSLPFPLNSPTSDAIESEFLKPHVLENPLHFFNKPQLPGEVEFEYDGLQESIESKQKFYFKLRLNDILIANAKMIVTIQDQQIVAINSVLGVPFDFPALVTDKKRALALAKERAEYEAGVELNSTPARTEQLGSFYEYFFEHNDVTRKWQLYYSFLLESEEDQKHLYHLVVNAETSHFVQLTKAKKPNKPR